MDTKEYIALENINTLHPSVIANAERAIRRTKNAGFSLESYHALSAVDADAFKSIDPRKLTQSPSSTQQQVALEAISGSDALKMVGAAIAAGGVAAIFYKLIKMVMSKMSGGDSDEHTSTNDKAEDVKKAIEKADPVVKEIDKFLEEEEEVAGKPDREKMGRVEIAKSITKAHAQPKDKAKATWYKNIAKVTEDEKGVSEAVREVDKFRGSAFMGYLLTLPAGCPGIMALPQLPGFKDLKLNQVDRLVSAIEETASIINDIINSSPSTAVEKLKANSVKLKQATDDLPKALEDTETLTRIFSIRYTSLPRKDQQSTLVNFKDIPFEAVKEDNADFNDKLIMGILERGENLHNTVEKFKESSKSTQDTGDNDKVIKDVISTLQLAIKRFYFIYVSAKRYNSSLEASHKTFLASIENKSWMTSLKELFTINKKKSAFDKLRKAANNE